MDSSLYVSNSGAYDGTGFFLTGDSLGFSDSRFSTSFSPDRFLAGSLVGVVLLEILPYQKI